mgnify:CR=1 FL=1
MIFQETERTELKRVLNDTIQKEIVAFLNSFDGTIYIGVNDDGSILGVENLDETQKKIADIVTTQILPNPQENIELGTKYVDGKNIVEIKVFKGNSLYYIKKYGRSAAGCFIRVGTSCRSMTEEQIEERYRRAIKSESESIVDIENYNQSLSFSMMKNFYVAKGFHINEKTFDKNYNLLNRSGKYNFLAGMLADENDISLKVVRFSGKTKSDLIEKSEYGYICLLMAIDKVIARLDVLNITKSVLDGSATRKDKRLLDSRCLREAFLNAVAHNDWRSKISPSVYVFSDRIEIISTGGLPDGLSLQEFYEGCSKPRCPELMRILRDLEYVEQSGFGISKIIDVYGKDVFKITDNFITVVLPYDKEVMSSIVETTTKTTTETTTKTTAKNIDKLLSIIEANPKIKAKELCIMLGLTIDGVRYHLNKLKKQGKIRRVGSNKDGCWEIVFK